MPRPFPFPLQVGIDVCHIARLALILNSPSRAWMRANESCKIPVLGEDTAEKYCEEMEKPEIVSILENRQRFFARIFHPFEIVHYGMTIQPNNEPGVYDHEILHPMQVRHIAGRWAAKEAMIKAHRCRRLGLRDVLIMPASFKKRFFSIEDSDSEREIGAPLGVVLADAPERCQNLSVEAASHLETRFPHWTAEQRYAQWKRWEDGQEAQLNISHDGEYAIAVCLAYEPTDPV